MRPLTPCEQHFRRAAPAPLYMGLLTLLSGHYSESFRYCMATAREGAGRILLPHYRRAKVESDLEGFAHKLGLASTIVQFPGNSDDFVMISMPGGVELIVCYVQSKDALVRYAKKREELTQQGNMQHLQFLEFVPKNPVLPPASLFSILMHCPDEKDLGQLGMAKIYFPSPNPLFALGELDVHAEAERVQREMSETARTAKQKIEIKIKKGGNRS